MARAMDFLTVPIVSSIGKCLIFKNTGRTLICNKLKRAFLALSYENSFGRNLYTRLRIVFAEVLG
jgi:hypothetical protein